MHNCNRKEAQIPLDLEGSCHLDELRKARFFLRGFSAAQSFHFFSVMT